jgi:hypothetical protein
MWWECSECGGHFEHGRSPSHCPECGMAGVIFVAAEPDDPIIGEGDGDGLRSLWLQVGLDRPDLVAGT